LLQADQGGKVTTCSTGDDLGDRFFFPIEGARDQNERNFRAQSFCFYECKFTTVLGQAKSEKIRSGKNSLKGLYIFFRRRNPFIGEGDPALLKFELHQIGIASLSSRIKNTSDLIRGRIPRWLNLLT